MNYQLLTQTLVESFNALADEAQALTDRKTILEHKLRYAHEQFQLLADKHAPATAEEISETLANIQIPTEPHHSELTEASRVPLPSRSRHGSRHSIAIVIRDGRRVGRQLAASLAAWPAAASLVEEAKTSPSSRAVFSAAGSGRSPSSMATVTDLEQDFTVEGKKGQLECPFTRPLPGAHGGGTAGTAGTGTSTSRDGGGGRDGARPHDPSDPICAALADDPSQYPASPDGPSAPKCPIRFLDQHSPEEIARYVETHKHNIPRSHSVCVSRHQKNADQIRKLDAKYGSLVSMIQGLSQLHQPMLPAPSAPPGEAEPLQSEVDKTCHERVENWAQGVSTSGLAHAGEGEDEGAGAGAVALTPAAASAGDTDDEREGRFDRPLKEVRVGESPSRPWGISVPVGKSYGLVRDGRPVSPPPAPVVTLDTAPGQNAIGSGTCPYDHSKFMPGLRDRKPLAREGPRSLLQSPSPSPPPPHPHSHPTAEPAPQQPAFINVSAPAWPAAGPGADVADADAAAAPAAGAPAVPVPVPQMVFTGPVFIGYPVEQAMQIVGQWRGGG